MMLLKIKSKLKWPVTFARHYALSCRSHQIISRNGIKLSVLIVISMKLTFGKRENVKYKKQLACTMWSSRSWTPLLANLLINCLFSSVSAISYMCYPCYLIKQISPSYYFFISFINSPFLQVDLLWDIEDDQSNRCTQLWSLRAALAFRGEKLFLMIPVSHQLGKFMSYSHVWDSWHLRIGALRMQPSPLLIPCTLPSNNTVKWKDSEFENF